MNNFENELAVLINKYSLENASNTPDFILAAYMYACLSVYNATITHRAEWYSRMDVPGRGSIAYPEEKVEI